MVSTSGQQTAISEHNIIDVHDLQFNYGRNNAIDKLSFSVSRGEILGLIGKNGAGKTTTIHLLLGLLRYRKGRIRVLGLDPRNDNIGILDRCGFFPEQGEPYEWMRVESLFRMGQYSYSEWDRSLCSKLSEQLELDTRRRISDLSKGMLIKAKLIFALAHKPELLILDEPTNGLDPLSRHDVLNLIKSSSTENDVTVLVSSHNLDEIADLATQVCIINEGKNVLSNSMDTIKSSFVLIEVCSDITIPESFYSQVIRSRRNAGKTQFLVLDRTDPDVVNFIEQPGEKVIELKAPSLKELFVFVTGNSE